MRAQSVDNVQSIVGWPEGHFVTHRKQAADFDAGAMRALLALRSTSQRVENALGGWFCDGKLTPQKFGVLVVLSAEGAPVSLSKLRRFLGTTQANITGLVSGLERDGFIDRKASAEDRRVSYISLSRSGKRVVATTLPDYFKRSRVALRGLTQNEKKMLLELLGKVAHGFNAAD